VEANQDELRNSVRRVSADRTAIKQSIEFSTIVAPEVMFTFWKKSLRSAAKDSMMSLLLVTSHLHQDCIDVKNMVC
jgi:hypothetical protein